LDVGIGASATFQVVATDLDGIQSAVFEVTDANGVVIITDAQLQANTVTTAGLNGKTTYDITIS